MVLMADKRHGGEQVVTAEVICDIREVTPADYRVLADLLVEMQAHYRAACPPRDDIVRALQDRPAGSRILIACRGSAIIGLATFSAVYPGPGLTSGHFLKDLYVASTARGQGIGKRLMRHLAHVTRSEGLQRIDWTVDANDRDLATFYATLGSRHLPEKAFYRLTGPALDALAESG